MLSNLNLRNWCFLAILIATLLLLSLGNVTASHLDRDNSQTNSTIHPPAPVAALHDFKYDLINAPYFKNLTLDQVMFVWIDIIHSYTTNTLKVLNPTLSLFDLTRLLTQGHNIPETSPEQLYFNVLRPISPHLSLRTVLRDANASPDDDDQEALGNDLENDLFQIKTISSQLKDEVEGGHVYYSRSAHDNSNSNKSNCITGFFRSFY